MATWLDRSIGWLSPQRGLRRVHARHLMEVMASYEGARGGRRTDGWITASNSADAESQAVQHTLRDRARDLVRNNPYAARAVEVKVANTIGAGIVAEVPPGRSRDMWERFVDNCDADGRLDFYGLQALTERCRMESGEVLVRFVPSKRIPGSVAFKLRVLEPDFLDTTRDGQPQEDGNSIRNGIEYDRFGSVVAYHLYHEHPGDTSIVRMRARGRQSERVPAEQVVHLFRRLRPGQTRGVTDFAPVMLRMRDLDDYDDAEVMRKKIEACFAAFVTSPAGADGSNIGPVSTDEKGRLESLFPAMIEHLQPGEAITFADPKASGGYADFQRFTLRAICAGTGVPYELATGDLSQVNYSSARVGIVDFRRRVEQDQWHMYIPQLCERVGGWFRDELALVTRQTPRVAFQWTPPRFELLDPMKETQADLEACLAGFEPFGELVRKRGWTLEEVYEGLEKHFAELDRRKLVLKSDPRVAAAPGASNAAPKAPVEDEEAA